MDARLFSDLLPENEDFLLDIHTAASIGCDERVRDIIENSENKNIVDECNRMGWTPLMYAACCANLKVVLLLLEEGADTALKNYEGHTALTLASKCGSGDVVNLLIDNGAKVNEKDLKGWTALFYATAFGHRSVVQLLIERAALVDIMDDDERITPLMLAAAAGHEMIVRDFLQLGINFNVECKSGDTARSFAIKYGHMNVKNLIDACLQQQLKRKSNGPNGLNLTKNPDLPSLLRELQLTKYYPVFENHGIDLNTFWLLTDEDLKELGIQLLGPRKKMCMAISQYHDEKAQKNNSKENSNFENLLMENKKLHHFVEKLKAMVSQEKNSRKFAERNLADGIRSIENYSEMLNSTVCQVLAFLQKLKENQDYMRSLLCNTFQDVNFSNSGLKISIFHLLDCMQKLVESEHQNMLVIQQTNLNN